MGKTKKVKGTKQQLEYTPEEEKFHIKQLKYKNPKQKELVQSIMNNQITFCSGVAGSGKTMVSLFAALKLLEKKQIDKIVLIKSVQTIQNEEIGFMPGDMMQKLYLPMISFYGNLDKLIGKEERERLVKAGLVEVQPITFLRGVTLDSACCILDECQNVTMDTFKTIITRIGENTRFVICGDCEQTDLKNKNQSSLSKLLELFKDDDWVGTITFTDEDCVRNPLIPKLLQKIRTIE